MKEGNPFEFLLIPALRLVSTERLNLTAAISCKSSATCQHRAVHSFRPSSKTPASVETIEVDGDHRIRDISQEGDFEPLFSRLRFSVD